MTPPYYRSSWTLLLLLASCASNGPGKREHIVEGVIGIDPRAKQALTRMCDALKGAERLTFRAEVLIDEVQARGQKIQYEGAVEVWRQGQSAMRADMIGDINAERVIYNGSTLTIEHAEDHDYATTAAPPTLDAALDEAARRYGIVIPFADLLYSDPEVILTENAVSGSYLGIHAVRGKPCHHLAFSTPDLAWQVWIDQGEPAVPAKMVITYVHESGSPQYVGAFTSWNLAPTFKEGLFEFTPATGAQAIELLEVAGPSAKSSEVRG